jgi:hypothetical protein
MNNLSSDKKPDILFSLILGLIPAYLFHLTYSPSNVLIEEKQLNNNENMIYKKCIKDNCKCFILKKDKRCSHNY